MNRHFKILTLVVMLNLFSFSSLAWSQDELDASARIPPPPPPPIQTQFAPPPPAAAPLPALVGQAATPAPNTPAPEAPPVVSQAPAVPLPQNVPPAPTAVTSADVEQFQSWLKNNQDHLVQKPVKLVQAGHIPEPPLRKKIPPRPRVHLQKGLNAPLVQSPPISFEQSRKVMLDSAPPSPPPSPESTMAFNGMVQQNMPLSPQQVVKLRQLIDTSQRAASIQPNVPPKPVSSTLMINLAPGATPPAIRLAQGYVSSLVFVDSTGAPWPIASYDIGDPKTINQQWDGKSNILLLQSVAPYSSGNIVIRLVGLPTPITLEIVSGQRVVDYRTDIHVSGIGPNSKEVPIGTPLPPSANQLLLSILDGVAPAGSKQMSVKGGDAQAWILGDKMYVRTRFTVLSPGWIGKMVSPDGMIAYEMQTTSSVLISQYGNPIELKIEGF